MHGLDYAVVFGYLAFTIFLGVVFSRNQSQKEFFEAGGSMGILPVGLSVMATLFSSNSFVVYPSVAYQGGFRIWVVLIAQTLIMPIVMFVFIPLYTRLKCKTAYEYLEIRFGVGVRLLASALFIVLRIAWMAAATFAASIVIANVAGVDQYAVIVVLGVVSILYTMMGGLRAVMWTDVAQFFVFAATIVATLYFLSTRIDGGVSGMFETYVTGRDDVFFDFSPDLALQYGSWALLIGMIFESLSASGADQVTVQRYLSAKSERTSQVAYLLNVAGIWVVIPSLLFIGVGLFAYYDHHPGELRPLLKNPDAIADSDLRQQVIIVDKKADGVLPNFVSGHFPAGLKGLFLAAILAAIMSSIDSGVHSVTTAIVVDFRDRLWPHLKPDDERDDVTFIRVLIVLIGALAVGAACLVDQLGTVFDIGKKLMSAFGGPLLAVFILAMFSRRATSRGVFVGTLLAAVVTLALLYLQGPISQYTGKGEWFSAWFWVIGFTLAAVFSYVASLVDPGRHSRSSDPMTFGRVLRESRTRSQNSTGE